MTERKRRSRRSLLGGALALAGLVGSGLATKLQLADGAETEAAAQTPGDGKSVAATHLFLDRYTLHSSGSGIERRKGDQTLLRGTLLSAEGEKVGELFASAITMPGPVDEDSPHTPRMEMQTLQLRDGTILAMGTVFAQDNIPNIYTVIGGTGHYAGLRGTYTFDDNPNVARPVGRSALHFDLTGV